MGGMGGELFSLDVIIFHCKKGIKKEKQSKEDYFKIKCPAGAFEYEEVNFRKKLGPI